MTKTFEEVISGIRKAKKGVEVREDLAQMGEYCQQFTQEAGTRADAAKAAAETAATNAKASEKKATDAVAGIEQTKADAVQAVQNAQTTATDAVQQAKSTATNAVTAKQTKAVQAVGTAQTGAVKAVDDERDAALQQVADSTRAAQTAASNASTAANAAGNAATAAGGYASNAASSADASSGSASAAATSESNAATSAQSAGADADRAEAAAALAGTRANTDKTLKTENAPADAAAVGNIILDFTKETPQPIFYSKAEVDKLLKGKLDLNDTADNAVKWNGLSLRQEHNLSDTWIPVFSDRNVDYVLKSEIADLNGVATSGSDYTRFTDGTQICWGRVSPASSITSTEKYVSFPIPFAENAKVLTTMNANMSGVPVQVGWETSTGFTIGCGWNGIGGGGDTSWFAIGRWK